jgi:hypothetical protein
MSVLLKGMEMPKDCWECPMQVYYSSGKTWCKSADMIIAEDYKPIPFDGKPKWCPLVEVSTPHGKLVEFIDVATFEDEDSGTEKVNLGEAFAAYFKMREAKPVIEAEGEG